MSIRNRKNQVSPDLMVRLRACLLECGPFESNSALRSAFADPHISIWRDYLPEASNPFERVESVIAYLQNRHNTQGENGVVLLLRVFAERSHPRDACYTELLDLADEIGGGSGSSMRDTITRAESDRSSIGCEKMIKILFLAANPFDTDRLRLDEESRAIDAALRTADFRDRFDVKQHWAVRVGNVQEYLLRHRPDIVHFSGHGSTLSEIVLEDTSGNSHPVSPRALGRLFSILKDNIRCVVLNACYSESQAEAIAEHIDCVIGMSDSMGDVAVVSFATAFYRGLGYGRSIKTAFDLGCVEIDMENLNEQDIPRLISPKVDPSTITFVA